MISLHDAKMNLITPVNGGLTTEEIRMKIYQGDNIDHMNIDEFKNIEMNTKYFNSIIQNNFIPMKIVKFNLNTTTDVSMKSESDRNAVDLEKEQFMPLGTELLLNEMVNEYNQANLIYACLFESKSL